MNEKKVLDSIRKYTLWAVLASAALLLVLEILKAWDVITTTSGGNVLRFGSDTRDALTGNPLDALMGALLSSGGGLNFATPTVNVWGHIEETLAIIVGVGAVVLLALLVSSRTKVGKIDAAAPKPAPAKVATATVAAPAAKAPVAKAAAAKAPVAKAPAAKAGSARPKK